MTDTILKIACAAMVLGRRDTWDAFDWNRSECGWGDAIETLLNDIRDLQDDTDCAMQAYFGENR